MEDAMNATVLGLAALFVVFRPFLALGICFLVGAVLYELCEDK